MPRNGGSTVDVAKRQVCDRDGCWYDLDRLEVSGGALYYARAMTNFDLVTYHERWLLPDQSLSVTRFTWAPGVEPHFDWYIETDLIDVARPLWTVRDGYIDLGVFEGSRYFVEDADELADALESGEIPVAEAAVVLRALERLCEELRSNGNSVSALLSGHASGLPK